MRSRAFWILVATTTLLTNCNPAIDTARVEEEVRSILRVPTYELAYREVVYVGVERSFLGIQTVPSETLFSIDIRVQAGVDLSDGVEVSGSSGEVTVTLPDTEILLVDAVEPTIREYFARESRRGVTMLAYYDEIDRAKRRVREDALERGILESARRSAQERIRLALQAAGIQEVRFE